MIEFVDEVNEETQRINELFSAESMEEHRREIDGDVLLKMDKCVDNLKNGIASNPINIDNQLTFGDIK